MTIQVLNGNILGSGCNIIVQQVNCKGVMGSGLAGQIKKILPQVYKDYKKMCKTANFEWEILKGTVSTTRVMLDNRYYWICSIFGQDGYGRDKQYTDYAALSEGLSRVEMYGNSKKMTIAIPYGIGCGLGGGDWEYVYQLLENKFSNYAHGVTLWKLTATT